jgi:hypothetical protein
VDKIYVLKYYTHDDPEYVTEIFRKKSEAVERVLELAAYPNSEVELRESSSYFVWTMEAYARSDEDQLFLEYRETRYVIEVQEIEGQFSEGELQFLMYLVGEWYRANPDGDRARQARELLTKLQSMPIGGR